MSSSKLKIFTFCAAAHLLLSALSAAHFGEWKITNQRLSDALYTWGEFTGSSNIYSFFAPYVGEQISVLYTLADSNQVQRPWMLEGSNREINIRIATVYNFLYMSESDDLLCRSFGNNALRLHPEAEMVRISVIQQTMPSLTTARDSVRVPRWEPIRYKDYTRLNP